VIEWSSVGPPWWDDKPCLIVGTGPSLQGVDLSRLQGLGHVLAVKESYHDLPFADLAFGLDLPWVHDERANLTELAQRMPLYIAYLENVPHTPIPRAFYLKRDYCFQLSEDPQRISSGGHSGFGALNLAYLKRAKRIYLFGFDYHGGHYYSDGRYGKWQEKNQSLWIEGFFGAKALLDRDGVVVINASPKSAVKTFPRVSVEQALFDLRPAF
jgi:hypothetical protein